MKKIIRRFFLATRQKLHVQQNLRGQKTECAEQDNEWYRKLFRNKIVPTRP